MRKPNKYAGDKTLPFTTVYQERWFQSAVDRVYYSVDRVLAEHFGELLPVATRQDRFAALWAAEMEKFDIAEYERWRSGDGVKVKQSMREVVK